MKELSKMYDIIFQDEELQKLFLSFHSKNWYQLDMNQRFSLISKINERVANLYEYEVNKIKHDKVIGYGSHSAFKWEISFNDMSLEYDNGYEVIDTYFHELRHAFQNRCVQNKLTDKEEATEEQKESWKKNLLPGNYFGGNSEYYKFQSIEQDAWITGMLFARKIYFLNKKVINEPDEEWEKYCNLHRDTITLFISDNLDAKVLLEKTEKEIDEIYASKSDDIEQLEKGSKYVDEILKNNEISKLGFNDVGILLSPYAFFNLDITQKVELIKRYRDLTRVDDRKVVVKENTVGSIKVGRNLHFIEDSYGLVNDILSDNFRNIVDNLVAGTEMNYEVSDRAKKELKLNMYRDENGKFINFIKDSENLLLFSVQPYARYETYYILEEFMKLKKIELEAYGKNSEIWKFWERFYNNNLIYKTFSKLVDMPFSEYYNIQLGKYRERIAKYKSNNKR